MVVTASRRAQADARYVSFTAPRQPAPLEDDPWKVYQNFTNVAAASPEVAAQIATRRKSVLDFVRGQMDRLEASPRLGKADRDKLDLHFTSIRDLETKLAQSCKLPDATVATLKGITPQMLGTDAGYEKVGPLFVDLVALAIACGYTNVATLMWGGGANQNTLGFLGQRLDRHLISHRVVAYDNAAPLDGAKDMLFAIDRWHAQQFGALVSKLAAYEDASGSILDNSVVLWTNEISEGAQHSYRDLPFVLAGSAGGYLKQGIHTNLSVLDDPLSLYKKGIVENAPHNKLLTTIANAMGVKDAKGGPITKFGTFGDPGEYEELKSGSA
jgi:hypothetical protein